MLPYSTDFFLTHYILSLLLTSLTSFSLGIFILVKNARAVASRTFAIFLLSVAWWSLMQALIGTWPNRGAWLQIVRIEHIGHVFLPSLFLHFIHANINLQQRRRLLVSYAISLSYLCIVPTRLLIDGVDLQAIGKYAIEPGPLYLPYVVWFVGTIVEALVKLRKAVHVRARRPHERMKLQYVFLASCIGYAGGLPNFFYVFDLDVFPLTPFSTYLVPVFALLIGYSIIRHQLLDIQVVIRKSLVYSILVGIITAVYLSFVLVAEKLLQGIMGYRSLIGSVAAGFAIALGFTPLKDAVQRLIDRFFFKGGQLALAEENERLRQEVAHSEKLKAVATLAAGMAHEIKNPLTSIKTFTEHLPYKHQDPVFREKFVRLVGQEVEKMSVLIQRLLEFSKPRTPELRPVNVSEVIEETLEFLQGTLLEKRVRIVKHYGQVDDVSADPEQLKQVLLNIFLNSLEAIHGSGSITVSTWQQDGHLRLMVADTGTGIPRRELQRVFDPFYTTKLHGTGLGLSVVHSIIREHGGRVQIESVKGQGTTVRITLPTNGGNEHGATSHLSRG